jgi:hypothetical protein
VPLIVRRLVIVPLVDAAFGADEVRSERQQTAATTVVFFMLVSNPWLKKKC